MSDSGALSAVLLPIWASQPCTGQGKLRRRSNFMQKTNHIIGKLRTGGGHRSGPSEIQWQRAHS